MNITVQNTCRDIDPRRRGLYYNSIKYCAFKYFGALHLCTLEEKNPK